jgi:hypothetical protein
MELHEENIISKLQKDNNWMLADFQQVDWDTFHAAYKTIPLSSGIHNETKQSAMEYKCPKQ